MVGLEVILKRPVTVTRMYEYVVTRTTARSESHEHSPAHLVRGGRSFVDAKTLEVQTVPHI